MRNDLLADIVIASGGTVTDSSNMNSLLADWLDVAGTDLVSREEAAIEAPIEEAEPVTYDYAKLDGVNNRWVLSSSILLTPSNKVKFKFKADSSTIANSYRRFLGSENYGLSVDTGNSADKFRLTGCTATLDGVPISNSNTPIPIDGLEHELVISPTVTESIEVIAGLNGRDDRNVAVTLYDFEVLSGDVITNQIPLTNKEQGANQLATIGTVNATLDGYSESVWT